jgi:hypothetical protein
LVVGAEAAVTSPICQGFSEGFYGIAITLKPFYWQIIDY